jgi:hypothetical protein
MQPNKDASSVSRQSLVTDLFYGETSTTTTSSVSDVRTRERLVNDCRVIIDHSMSTSSHISFQHNNATSTTCKFATRLMVTFIQSIESSSHSRVVRRWGRGVELDLLEPHQIKPSVDPVAVCRRDPRVHSCGELHHGVCVREDADLYRSLQVDDSL